jgi:hypothetical protein
MIVLSRCHGLLFLTLLLAGLTASAATAQPLIEYRFDDTPQFNAGTVPNARSTNYTGALAGTRSQVRGALGNAADLDGSTGAMSAAGSSGLSFGSGLTIEAFVRRDTNTGEDAIVSKWYGGDQFLLTFYPNGNGRLQFFVRGAAGTSGSVIYDVPNTVYLGEWVHVAATYDGAGSFRLYWNGALVASSFVTISGMAGGSIPIRIGDANNTWSRFDGGIDEVKIWNRALAASELSRPLHPRVLVVEYTSSNPTYNDPVTISNGLIANIGAASNYVRHEIVQWNRPGIRPPQRTGGTLEWAVGGPWREAYGLGVGQPTCDTQMVTMGFNYERQLPEATHSFGHRLERNYQTWWGMPLWNAFDGQYGRYAFGGTDQPPLVTTGTHCGNVHFPPNADQHYEYNSSDVVSSNCATWRSDGGGTYVNLSCSTWGCNELGFLNWWMARMPGPTNANGPGGTRLKNWWEFR